MAALVSCSREEWPGMTAAQTGNTLSVHISAGGFEGEAQTKARDTGYDHVDIAVADGEGRIVRNIKSLYDRIKKENFEYEKFYDFALISSNDKIIPTQNQINFWQNNAPYKLLESGHFPFYNFNSWDEIAEIQ